MKREPTQHHYVPKVYLKNFACDNNGNIYRLDIKSPFGNVSPKLSHINRVCKEDDFYKIETKELLNRYNLQDPYFIEKKAFDYENSFLNRIFEKLTKKRVVSNRDAKRLMKTIFSIKRRNKSFKEAYHNSEIVKVVTEKNIQDLKLKAELSKDKFLDSGVDIIQIADRVEGWMNELMSKKEYITDMYREGFIMDLSGEGREKDFIERLATLKFFVFQTTIDYPFITSDNPGCTVTPNEKIVNTGFSDWSVFSFPINPQLLFLVINGQRDEHDVIMKKIHYRHANRQFVDMANKAVVSNCNETLLSHSKEVLNKISNLYRPHIVDKSP